MASKNQVLQTILDLVYALDGETLTKDIGDSIVTALKAYSLLSDVTNSTPNFYSLGTLAGSANTYTASVTGFTAYISGDIFVGKVNVANTTASTLNVESVGAKAIKKKGTTDVTTALTANDLVADQMILLQYDGTNLQLLSGAGGSGDGIPLSTVTAKGDIIAATGNGAVDNLAVGTNDFVLTAASGETTGLKWAAIPSSYVPLSTVTAKGDLILASGSGAVANLAVGTNTYVLTADSTATNGVKWAASSSGATITPSALTDGSTISCDLSLSTNFTLTIAGTGRTLEMTNPTPGQQYKIKILQDGTGSRTITTYTFKKENGDVGTVKWLNSASAPGLCGVANAYDILIFTYWGSGVYSADMISYWV